MLASSPQPSSVPGMPCPECGGRIVACLEQLLAQSPIVCPACGLELKLDAQASSGALEALRRLDQKLRQIPGAR